VSRIEWLVCSECWHWHMDYRDEACVSCGCDLSLSWTERWLAPIVAIGMLTAMALTFLVILAMIAIGGLT
jgi:hypothetical protein